jgi:hypothetical protein
VVAFTSQATGGEKPASRSSCFTQNKRTLVLKTEEAGRTQNHSERVDDERLFALSTVKPRSSLSPESWLNLE